MFTQTGTPYYASPEVWKDKPYDSKSDIWSLGCVLYEICALAPPFTARDMKGLYNKVIKGEYTRIPDEYPDHLANVVDMCLQVIPARRPTAAQLLRKREIVLHLRENNIYDTGEKCSVNLLDTIKLPTNFSLIKDRLPTAKYESELQKMKETAKKTRNFSARGRNEEASALNKNLLDRDKSLLLLKKYQRKRGPGSSKNLRISQIKKKDSVYNMPPRSNRPALYGENYDRPSLQLPPIQRPAGMPSYGNLYHIRQRSESRESSRVIPTSNVGNSIDSDRGYRRRADIASRQKIQQHLINKAFGLPVTPINRR